ncbi:MAG: hypothetical protein Q7R89_00855 [bacterium]|nr:hypothetical protein [bacterium]
MKKTIIIIITILIVALAAFFGWYLLIRNPETPLSETIGNILPFGQGDNTNIPVPPIGDSSTSFDNSQEKPFGTDEFGSPTAGLFRLSNTPVAGAVTFKRGTVTIVRYVDRATGHIYDTNLATLTKTKVTNQTLPKIYEAYFRPDGNAVLLRSLKDDSDVVENLTLTLTPPKGTSTDPLYAVSSILLRGDINSVAIGSGNNLLYTQQDTSSIITSAFNGTGIKTLLTSPFTDWRLATAGNNLVVYTKASADASGFAYTLNTSSKAFTKILGPLNGLIVIPDASGNRVLYSYVGNDKTSLLAKNLTKNTLTEILPATLAEKCIWSVKKAGILFCGAPIDSPGPLEPDGWYRGTTHFSDRIWLFDTNIDIAQALAEPRTVFGVDIDLVEPKLSPDEDYLIFINKIDLSLWALKLD